MAENSAETPQVKFSDAGRAVRKKSGTFAPGPGRPKWWTKLELGRHQRFPLTDDGPWVRMIIEGLNMRDGSSVSVFPQKDRELLKSARYEDWKAQH